MGDRTLDLGEVQFGESAERIEFVDKYGIPILVDKWGIMQRPFDAAAATEVLDHLVGQVDAVVRTVLRGLRHRALDGLRHPARRMRTGRAIGHDSDVDLAFLSRAETPAEMQAELMAIHRTLVRAGYQVVHKSGAFITVLMTAPDGAPVSIDVYICFHVGDLYYATATLQTELPEDAILPLGELSFHGRMLPAPADPDRVLAASYGPGWRVPDPGFRHGPTHRVIRRFDEWFGNYMRQRRDWEVYWRQHQRAGEDDTGRSSTGCGAPSTPSATVLDIGAGAGEDAMALAAEGREVWALDYARDAYGNLWRECEAKGLDVRVELLNLYDLRDTLTMAAVIAREAGPRRVIHLRHTLDAMPAAARENLWRLASMVLRGLGSPLRRVRRARTPPEGEFHRFYDGAGRQWEVSRDELRAEWRASGAREVHREAVPTDPGRTRWRMVLSWS